VAAYVIVEVEVTDADAYEIYKPLAAKSVAEAGGRYLARGGRSALLEGDVEPSRVVVLEFPDFERAQEWFDGAGYLAARAARAQASHARMIVVDGVPEN
jgi:uncharacterized protein (DUF1330 family)